jgi:hypothetical protein
MYIYIHIYIYTYIYMYMYRYMHIYIYVYTNICVYMYTCMYIYFAIIVHIFTWPLTYIYTNINIYICVCAYIYRCIYIYIHLYIYACILDVRGASYGDQTLFRGYSLTGGWFGILCGTHAQDWFLCMSRWKNCSEFTLQYCNRVMGKTRILFLTGNTTAEGRCSNIERESRQIKDCIAYRSLHVQVLFRCACWLSLTSSAARLDT